MTAIWIDQGGTFTDVVRVAADGHVRVDKVLSDGADLVALGLGAEDVRRGTTVATNALLERGGVPVLLLTTTGFGDLPWIGDQTRPELFSLEIRRPEPLCTEVLEVGARIDAAGELLSPVEVSKDALAACVAKGIEAAAVVLVHGPLCPAVEREVALLCRQAGFRTVSMGHEVAPSRGFLARLHTTLADAALTPLLPTAPGRYMRSDGGLAERAQWRGCHAVLSGPAGGVVATADLVRRAGVGPAFGLDMGGTSTDVCRVEGAPERTDHVEIGGLRLRVPAVRLETVAAGGGSCLSIRGGVMVVGPESAGADPGPAAYGRGGPATLTDAEAVLGRLPAFPSVCGPNRDGPLDVDAAHAALHQLLPHQPVEAVAMGFRRVASETMARAVRQLAAARGADPRHHALIAFGGAGPGHACAVARGLGIHEVLVPWLAGGFSAVGIGMARRRAERVVPVTGGVGPALEAARADLPFTGTQCPRVAARYVGTSTLIEVPLPDGPWPSGTAVTGQLRDAFCAAHRDRFGFDRPEMAVEAVEVRVSVEEVEPDRTLRIDVPPAPVQTTQAWFDGWRTVACLAMTEADGVVGPALLTGVGTTVVVEPGWRVSVGDGFIRLTDPGAAGAGLDAEFDPVHTAVFGLRLMGVAEQMGARLARLARSVSIRERRDFSCAVFDKDGRLVANAPHVPVHLGAMGETVRDLLSRRGDALMPDTAWASNDPYAGGSHLPDITVTMPVFHEGSLVGLVAARGHHVDVGGVTAGSMPPHATRIDEEGFVLQQVPIVGPAGFRAPPLPGCRQPEEVRADLEAQVAACAAGAQGLQRMVQELGVEVLHAQMAHLGHHAALAVGEALRSREGIHRGRERLDDGTVIEVVVQIDADRAHVDVLGPAHPGNLNAPRAVAIAAILYVFRCLVDVDLPILNEGALVPLEIELDPRGLFDPVPPRAVAGGNVETSQRLVDALLSALGAQAPSQGTMNNLTVHFPRVHGTKSMSTGTWYETIGGGSGAGPGFDGAHGVQVHMTNTRATDVEDLETRFPVRLVGWQLRRGSGGRGRWTGGMGVDKEWLFLDGAEIALLAGRRDVGAPGLAGGCSGQRGVDECDVGAGWVPAPKQWSARPGDRLRIRTPGGGGFGPPAGSSESEDV